MIIKHKVVYENNEEVLYVYLDGASTEFARNYNNTDEEQKSLTDQIRDYVKSKNINFTGKVVKVLAGSLVVATMLFAPQVGDRINAQAATTQETTRTTYVVQSGDTLSEIAQVYGTTVENLRNINNLRTDTIYVGQSLQIGDVSTYTVQSGDTLSGIASRYGITTTQLKQYNKLTSDIIYPGQTLRVSGIIESQPVETTTYTVQAGDSLWSIANRFNTTTNELRNLNNLTTDTLQIGQTLQVAGTIEAPVETPVETTTYTVQSGDTLSEIAQRYGMTTNQLRETNNLTTDVLQIGQTLQITGEVADTPAPVETTTYTVQAGDSLWSIANRFNTTTDELRNLNNLTTDTLQIGQTLQVTGEVADTPDPVETTTYTVQAGDSLWSIANRFNTTTDELRNLNNLTTDTLQIGQTLQVTGEVADTPAPVETTTYTVQAGDSLWSIANRFNTTTDELRNLNNLTTDTLQIGQTLQITGEAIAPVETTYTVQAGDSLWGVATRYNMTVDRLRSLNNLTSDTLYPGQTLVVSGTATETPAYRDITVTVRRYNGTVQYISLEEYIVGVVSAELPPYFHEESFKAQALAARTYAVARIELGETLSDTDQHQVYYDEYQLRQRWGTRYDEYHTKIRNAVYETRGQVITYNGEYIDALYFSTSNGRTEIPQNVWGGTLPYLQSVESPWDTRSPEFYDVKYMSYTEFSNRLGLYSTSGLYANVVSRTIGDGVETIDISGRHFSGNYVRSQLGLRSTDFDIQFSDGTVVISQRGWGHRVGLSQYGAHYMGQDGYSYNQIIGHYYQGVNITPIS